MIAFSMLAFLIYAATVAPLALLVLGYFRHRDPGRRSYALSAPRATPLGLTPAASRDLELRVSRRLYPRSRLSTQDAAA